MNRRRLPHLAPALCILAGLYSSSAFGSAQDLFGFGSVCPSQAGACTAFTQGVEAVYYNPAQLGVSTHKVLSFSYLSSFYDLDVVGPPSAHSKHTSPDRSGGVAFGAAVPLPLPSPISDRLALGLGMFIPDQSLIRARIPEAETPWFPVLGNRSNTLGVHGGIAARIAPWLRLGVGVKVLAELVGEISVKPGTTGALSSSIRDELKTTASPILGATFLPAEGLRIALVYRGEERGAFSLPVKAELSDSFPLEIPEIQIQGLAQYDPRQVVLGVGWEFSESSRVEVDAIWRQWSAYPTPIENATPAVAPQDPPQFSDTLSPRIGGEHSVALHGEVSMSFRLGYGYEPSPAPVQTTRNNHLDNHRHVVSGGLGLDWSMTDDATLRTNLFAQEHILVSRTHQKEEFPIAEGQSSVEENPGYPAITTKGVLSVFGVGMEVAFR